MRGASAVGEALNRPYQQEMPQCAETTDCDHQPRTCVSEGLCQLNGNIKLAAKVPTNAVKNRVVNGFSRPASLRVMIWYSGNTLA